MDLLRELDRKQTGQLKSAYELAENSHYDQPHAQQTAFLSLRLFDELNPLHELGSAERFWLLAAAILHDAGIATEGRHSHHKTALFMILNVRSLKFNEKERLLIGSIARYHRKSLPTIRHDHFAALSSDEKRSVSILSGILRVADGLDFTHNQRISDLDCKIDLRKIRIDCKVSQPPAKLERLRAMEKSKLLSEILHRDIRITLHGIK